MVKVQRRGDGGLKRQRLSTGTERCATQLGLQPEQGGPKPNLPSGMGSLEHIVHSFRPGELGRFGEVRGLDSCWGGGFRCGVVFSL